VTIPVAPKTSGRKEGRSALWLGPDEWLVIDESGGDLMTALSKSGALHSATDVSHRNVAIVVSGPGAEATISAGCPQDLSLGAFPVGCCTRTLFGKAEIVLFRTEDDTFRVECWRSFADFVFGLLAEGAEDAAH
jgi:sarcosine oxidase subunit gamma